MKKRFSPSAFLFDLGAGICFAPFAAFSSPYAEKASAPLRAIVALEQAEENSIRKLEGFEVLEYVVPHVFFPSWDERCEQAVLTFLDQVLGETEVYLLKCRPDEGAVELLASTIKE